MMPGFNEDGDHGTAKSTGAAGDDDGFCFHVGGAKRLLATRPFASHAPAMKQLAAAFLLFIGGVVPALAAEPATLTPAQAETWLTATPGVQVLDVRTKEEFATGHLANATLIPWTDKNFTDRAAKELDPRKPVLVYCQGGVRSAKAAAALVKLGFTEVRDMAGGIAAWQQAGKPTDKVAPKP